MLRFALAGLTAGGITGYWLAPTRLDIPLIGRGGRLAARRSELTVPDELVLNDPDGPMPHRPPPVRGLQPVRRLGLMSLCGHR